MTTPAPRWPFLPALLFELAQAFGLDTALAFADRHGGTIMYVPVRPGADHAIAQEFGTELLAWLVAHADARSDGDRKLPIPMGPSQSQALREAAVRDLTAQGRSRNQIARQLGLHARTVSAIRARLMAAQDSPQLSLFGEDRR